MKRLTKIIGTTLLAGTLLFGCSGKNSQNQSKLEQAVSVTQMSETISPENEKYNAQNINDSIPTNTTLVSEESKDSIVENNYESKNTEETFDLYKELAKKNTSLKVLNSSTNLNTELTDLRYDLYEKNEKKQFVTYLYTKVKENEKNTFKASVINSVVNIDKYYIQNNDLIIEGILDCDDPSLNGKKIKYTIKSINNQTIINDGLIEKEYEVLFEKNSYLNNIDEGYLGSFLTGNAMNSKGKNVIPIISYDN